MNKLISIGKWYTVVVLTYFSGYFIVSAFTEEGTALWIWCIFLFLPMAIYSWYNALKE